MPPFVEGSILEKNGSRRLIQWSGTPLRDSTGRAAGFVRLGEDVTEVRAPQAEAARRGEDQFREVANAAPLLIWTTGADNGCTFVNNAWLAFTGRTLEQELGHGWTANIHPADRDQCLATCTAACAERRNIHVEYRKRRADGEYRWVLSSGVLRFRSNGEFIGYVGTCYDITDLRRRREEDIARQKWESLGSLATGIAHDFNNLLGGILSQAELALAELADGESADAEIRGIQSVAIRGAEIVRQLMAYAGQEEAAIEIVNVSRLVEASRELLRVLAPKHVSLEFELAKDAGGVRASPGTVGQILINLVNNASEAIGERDGVIHVSTTRVSLEPHSLSNGAELPAGDYLQLDVADTGCGVPQESQARIFDPFYTTKSPGRGLGLAVVQGIVRRLGGAVSVRSSPTGSVFRILLPRAPLPQTEDREAGAGAGAKHSSAVRTVLIVEDEDPLRSAVADSLRRKGLVVLEARDGSEAVSMLQNHGAELEAMLLDVTFPGIASPEIIREAKRLCPDLRIIVTSAYGEETVATIFTGLTPLRFLRKPMRIAALLKLLARFGS